MEREKVARELHDGVIQSLVGIDMSLEAEKQGEPETAERLARIQQLIKQEVLNLRELMMQLRSLALGPDTLVRFIGGIVDRFSRETGVAAQFICDVESIPCSADTCTEIARIVQEALANVRRHSGARNVVVRLLRDGAPWKLSIADDGRGFAEFEGRLSQAELDKQWKGPAIIKERVRLIGGELTVESTRGEGASLEITFPQDDRARRS